MPESLADFLAARPDLSDKEVLSAWAEDVTTERPIPLAALTAYLRTAGLLRTLKAVAADPEQPQDVRDGLGDFLDHVADPRQANLDTTDPAVAAKATAVIRGLGPLLPDGGAAILAMGGGPRHGTAAIEDVASARAELVRRKAVADLRNAWAAVYNAGVAAIDAGEASGTLPALDELRAVAPPAE